MSNRDELINELVERSIEKRNMNLSDLIDSENLDVYKPGTVNILTVDEMNNAIVPCRGFMILAHEHYDEDIKKVCSEYAIYKEVPNAAPALYDSMNYDARYELEYIGDEVFDNMAFAIAWAADLIFHLTNEDHSVHLIDHLKED